MSRGKHKLIRLIILLSVQVLSFPIRSSADDGGGFFPTVNVALKNDANHSVYLKCGFDETNKQVLQKLEPGDTRSWSFVEILFPLRWCYVHINDDNRGAFWAYSVFLKCRNCSWSIREDGPYHWNHLKEWKRYKLFLEY